MGKLDSLRVFLGSGRSARSASERREANSARVAGPRSFAIPALRPAVQSLAVIAGVILLYRRFGVYSAAGGVTVGAIGWGPRLGVADAPRRRNTPGPEARQGTVVRPLPAARAAHRSHRPRHSGFNHRRKDAATGFAAGSVASLAFARRIAFLAIALGAQPITVVFFPEFASAFARGQHGAFRKHLRTAIFVTAGVLVPGALILGGFAPEITRLLLERGMFRAEDTARVAGLLKVYAVGVPIFAANSIMVFALHARQEVWAPLNVGLGTFGLYVVLLLTLPGRFGLDGVVMALVIADAVRLAILATIVFTRNSFRARGRLDVGAARQPVP